MAGDNVLVQGALCECFVDLCSVATSFTGKYLLSCLDLKLCGYFSSSAVNNEEIQKRRSQLFSQEQARQKSNVGRIEKIEVRYVGLPEEQSFVMNKGISTPHNCAQHMSEMLTTRSVLAEVNGQLWDMHRPLEEDCELKLLHSKENDPVQVNRAFWRSCSFMLGAIVEQSFKDNVEVKLHSFPPPNVKSGSFIYDADLQVDNWKPTKDELRILSAQMVKLASEELPFERLEIDAKVALNMFTDNEYKSEQIPQVAAQSSTGNSVIVYRIKDHVDISRGPMMGNTNLLGRCSVTAVLKLESSIRNLYRFQGVALPKGFLLNHFAYGLIEQRSAKQNPAPVPERNPESQHVSEAVSQ